MTQFGMSHLGKMHLSGWLEVGGFLWTGASESPLSGTRGAYLVIILRQTIRQLF